MGPESDGISLGNLSGPQPHTEDRSGASAQAGVPWYLCSTSSFPGRETTQGIGTRGMIDLILLSLTKAWLISRWCQLWIRTHLRFWCRLRLPTDQGS